MISASSRWGCPIEDNLVDNNNGFNEQFPGFSKKNWASAFLKIRSLCLQLGSADFLLTFLRAFWKSSPTSLGLNCLSILGENSYHFLHPLSFVCFYFCLLSCKTHLMCQCAVPGIEFSDPSWWFLMLLKCKCLCIKLVQFYMHLFQCFI